MTETTQNIRDRALAAIERLQSERAAERAERDAQLLETTREGLVQSVRATLGVTVDPQDVTVLGRKSSNPNEGLESATARVEIEGMAGNIPVAR